MKFAYNKRRQQYFLYLGLAWLLLGVFQIFLMEEQWWLGLGWIMLALLSFGSFIYRKRQYYVIVNSEYVMQSWPFGKQINVNEITSIKYFSEDYIIKSDTDEIRINTNLIEEDALETLKSKLLSISSNLV